LWVGLRQVKKTGPASNSAYISFARQRADVG